MSSDIGRFVSSLPSQMSNININHPIDLPAPVPHEILANIVANQQAGLADIEGEHVNGNQVHNDNPNGPNLLQPVQGQQVPNILLGQQQQIANINVNPPMQNHNNPIEINPNHNINNSNIPNHGNAPANPNQFMLPQAQHVNGSQGLTVQPAIALHQGGGNGSGPLVSRTQPSYSSSTGNGVFGLNGNRGSMDDPIDSSSLASQVSIARAVLQLHQDSNTLEEAKNNAAFTAAQHGKYFDIIKLCGYFKKKVGGPVTDQPLMGYIRKYPVVVPYMVIFSAQAKVVAAKRLLDELANTDIGPVLIEIRALLDRAIDELKFGDNIITFPYMYDIDSIISFCNYSIQDCVSYGGYRYVSGTSFHHLRPIQSHPKTHNVPKIGNAYSHTNTTKTGGDQKRRRLNGLCRDFNDHGACSRPHCVYQHSCSHCHKPGHGQINCFKLKSSNSNIEALLQDIRSQRP